MVWDCIAPVVTDYANILLSGSLQELTTVKAQHQSLTAQHTQISAQLSTLAERKLQLEASIVELGGTLEVGLCGVSLYPEI